MAQWYPFGPSCVSVLTTGVAELPSVQNGWQPVLTLLPGYQGS